MTKNIFSENKKGQVTIFIILAIMVVVLGALAYVFWPQLKTTIGLTPSNPSAFIQTCLENDLRNAVEKVSAQGGSVEPEYYYQYQDEKLEYLCYTNDYYKTCTSQRPLLIQHMEKEIESQIKDVAKDCFDNLKTSYESQGFTVEMKQGPLEINLLPNRVVAKSKYSLILTKESSEKYDSFEILLNNNLYELASIAKSIVEDEVQYGDSETTIYMDYYPELKIEKKKQSDGTTIYIITERDTNNKFQFASRSLVFAPGQTL